MSFLYAGALAITLLVVAPVIAHLLRVRRARVQPFPATHLLPKRTMETRKRQRMNDPLLLLVRALVITAIALVGATTLIASKRMRLFRPDGASMGIVLIIDDSLSMRVRDDGVKSRFDIVKQRAEQLVLDASPSDNIAVILAGTPARLALGPTTDLTAVERTVKSLQVSDRATDLDGALQLAVSLLSAIVQPARRVIVLSDWCDGKSLHEPLGEGVHGDIWFVPLDVSADVHDCAVVQAERKSTRIIAKISCSGIPDSVASRAVRPRQVVAKAADETVGKIELDERLMRGGGTTQVIIDAGAKASLVDTIVLEGIAGSGDWIAHNDRAPVAQQLRGTTIGVVTDQATSRQTAGGVPVAEQALRAIIAASNSNAVVQPVTVLSDNEQELARYSALVLDNPEPLSPELREALGKWLERGATALVALGTRSASAALGTSLQPLVSSAVHWQTGAFEVDTSKTDLGPSSSSLQNLAAKGRAMIPTDRLDKRTVLASWQDGQALVLSHEVGKGRVYVVGLPFDPAVSDFALRPSFLALLHIVLREAERRNVGSRIEVGGTWLFDTNKVKVRTPAGNYPVEFGDFHGYRARVVPELAGRYDIDAAGELDTRFAVISDSELDFRQRKTRANTDDTSLGSTEGNVDISRWIVMGLLGLLAVELLIRAPWSKRFSGQFSG